MTTKSSTNDAPIPKTSEQVASKLAYLARALKTPTIGRVWDDLADRARAENWAHEEYLAAVLERQLADRESAGTTMRIRTAHFPAIKTLEDFNLDHLPSLRKDLLAHLATSTFVAKAENVILLGPPGIGKTHLAIGLGVKATTPVTVFYSTPRTTGLANSRFGERQSTHRIARFRRPESMEPSGRRSVAALYSQ